MVSATLLATACARGPAFGQPTRSQARAPLHLALPQQAPFRGYRLAASFVDKGPFRDGAPLRRGALVNGLRVRMDASGLSLAESVSVPPLRAGVQVPEALGGGLLFWNDRALYTADSFLGPLTPLFDLGFRLRHVSFGPNFALLHSDDGQRFALDLRTRQRVPITPALLVDIATSPDGRVLALLEGGSCQESDDAGRSYHALNLPNGTRATALREESGTLLLGLSSGAQMRLEQGGTVQLEEAPLATAARPSGDAMWPLKEPPLERALAFGVPIGDEFAGVAVNGSVATVNLRTGELVQITRAIVPSDLACQALDSNGALLLVCNSSARGSVVISDVFGERPLTQARFPPGVGLDFAEGVLVAAARCDGQVRPAAVCVRGVDGRLRDFDVSAQLALIEKGAPQPKPGLPSPSIARWVPKVGGGAVAVLNGAVPGLLDAQTGSFVPFAPGVPGAVYEGSSSSEPWLQLAWVAPREGGLRGWLKDTGVSVQPDGRAEPTVYQFSSLLGAGARALAFDRSGHAFQSADWGRSWLETLAPPDSSSSGKVFAPSGRCSAVGCLLGAWALVGWHTEIPARWPHPRIVATPPALPRAALPLLTCKQLAAPTVSVPTLPSDGPDAASHAAGLGAGSASVLAGSDFQAAFPWAKIHPLNQAATTLGLRASSVGRVSPDPQTEPPPRNWAGFSSGKRYQFVPAFEPSGRLQSAFISWRTLFDAAAASDGASPSLQPDPADALPALPVLGQNAGEACGLVLDDGAPVWVHASGGVEAIGPRRGSAKLVSAVARGPHAIAVLSADGDGLLEVLEVSSGKYRRLFRLGGRGSMFVPANTDSLAVGARGALAVLRTPSGHEPATAVDPAVLFHEDGSSSLLAPWTRLFFAGAPECRPAPDDFRTVLQTARSWLRLVDGGLPVSDEALDAGMFAVLRVNSQRLCLESVELADAPSEQSDSTHATYLSARFVGPQRRAARLGFGPGFEFHQPLSCSLSASP